MAVERSGLRAWMIEQHAALVTRHPLAIVIVALLLAVAAWPAVSRLALRTGRLDLAPAEDHSVVSYREFNRAFGALHTVFLIVSGPAAEARGFADAAARGLAVRRDHVRSVIHRLDVEQLESQALHAATPAQLEELRSGLARFAPLWKAIARSPGVATLLEQIVSEITDEDATPPTVAEALQVAQVLDRSLRALDRILAAPPGVGDAAREFDALDPAVAERARRGVDGAGYLISRDGQRLLLVISPAYVVDEPEPAARLIAAVEEVLAPLRAAHPCVEVGYAGAPIQDVEEQATVAKDMVRTALFAYAAVLLLSFLAFRNVLVAVRSNLVLALAVYFTLALAYLLVGQLNIISSVFVAVLVGLGDDFGIYLFTLYRDAHARHGRGAMAHAIRTGVPGLFTGAATVTAAFLALQVQGFRAFRELGLIAGAGVAVAFLCMVVLLPAVIVLMEERFPLGIPAGPPAAHHPAAAGRGLGGWMISHILRWRGPIVVGGVALVCIAAVAVPRVGFEYDLTQLQSASAAAVRAEDALREHFGLGSDFVVVRSRTIAEAALAAARLRASPAVGSVNGVADVVPASPDQLLALLRRIAEQARGLADLPDPAPPVSAPDPAACRGTLEKMTGAIEVLRGLANMEDSRPLREALDALDVSRRQLLLRLAALPPARAAAGLATVTPVIATRLRRVRTALIRAADLRPWTLATLPPELRDRYVGRDGSLATYAWPAAALATSERMKDFVDAVLAVPGEVAGLPVMIFRMLELIRGGLLSTAMPALFAILVMVLLDFRDPRLAAYGLVPMAGGTLLTVGLMGWTGASWNPVNSIALSVMLGVGVDYGVNLVHRWQQERDVAVVLAGAGRAVLYAAATSVLGFGSLMLAQHRGLRSFGQTMALGNFCEMVIALVFLPALLCWRAPARRPPPEPPPPPC